MDLAKIPRGERRLNLGCGFDRRAGYVNVDLQEFHQPDIIGNVLDLAMMTSSWADEIVASDVIEHFKRDQTTPALLEWNRVLRHGGTLYMRTTYLPGLLRRMSYSWFGSLESHKQLLVNLFSMQAYEGDFHFTAFTEKLMRFYVWAAGFEMTTLQVKDNWLFEVWATKVEDYCFQSLIDAPSADTDFVTEAYRQILFREPDAEGLAGKINLLRGGQQSRGGIIKGLLTSDEREAVMMKRAPPFELEFDER